MTGVRRGVVAGASMAGLLAAAVLAEQGVEVVVVEPDALDDSTSARRGVPQGHHAHVLLTRGAEALEELLPGLEAELVAAGAQVGPARMGPDQGMRMVVPSGVITDTDPTGLNFVWVSRGLLEATVRRRVLALANVTVVRARASGLVPSGDARVRGLRVRDDRTSPEREIEADLVVDATGRRTSAPRWLVQLGYPELPETTVVTSVGYSTRWYRRPAERRAGWQASMINARPGENHRGAALMPVENDMFTVSLGGIGGLHPPTDEAGFVQWARDLPDPCIADAIEESEPVSAIRAYRVPESRLRHVERPGRWPAGFVMVGDAVCAFNPMYGQGMSVGALEALALRDLLRRAPGDLETTFRRRVADIVAGPWAMAAEEDLRWSDEPRSWLQRRRHEYGDAVRATATTDAVVATAMAWVALMKAAPESLARPAIASRVLRHTLRRRLRRTR